LEHLLLNNFQSAKKVNLLLIHARKVSDKFGIQQLSPKDVQKASFNVALLGGKQVSELQLDDQPILIYPGSPEPLIPSDENGLHQVVFVEANGGNISIQPLSLQQWHYQTIKVDITKCLSSKEAAGLIDSSLEATSAKVSSLAVSVVLLGQPNFNLNVTDLRRLIQSPAFFRIEDRFELPYDLEQLAREQTVRGLLVRRFQERIGNTVDEFERNQQLTALRFALQALEGKQVSLYEVKTN
jgi:DNA repair exonuclease SbcCD nuclease subunit